MKGWKKKNSVGLDVVVEVELGVEVEEKEKYKKVTWKETRGRGIK